MPQIKLRSSSLQPNIHLGGTPTASETTLTPIPVVQSDSIPVVTPTTEQPASSSNDVK